MPKDKILVIGANGQIGSVMTKALRNVYGQDSVIASDVHLPTDGNNYLPFEILDATDAAKINFIVERYRITQIYHLAAILSAKGEINPLRTWDVNMECLFNVLEAARQNKVKKVFFPSTIAVFGSNTPRVMTPQDTIRTPETVYGMSKVAGENWCSYYYKRYGVDVRGLRYPGIIGYQSMPGGGTTDYAVDIFHYAIKGDNYECFLNKNTRLPMLYMDDAIRATMELMDAPAEKISIRSSYNLSGMSFTPEELYSEIKKHLPHFKITYKPDFRQAIADSWPESIDDSQARKDWGWKEEFDLAKMTEDMIKHLKKKNKTPISD
jgi:nucleoside-diphosphate-sugar epimerase